MMPHKIIHTQSRSSLRGAVGDAAIHKKMDCFVGLRPSRNDVGECSHKIIQNLSHKARHDNMLQKICDKLSREFGLTPVIGAEVEFYVIEEGSQPSSQWKLGPSSLINTGSRVKPRMTNWGMMSSSTPRNDVSWFVHNNIEIKPEKGNGQFEIDIFPQETVTKTVEEISRAKKYLLSLPNVSLHPKPYSDDYGSAMHFHINFLDSIGNNFFDDMDNLYHTAQSLCHFLEKHFLIFAPNKDHYVRFVKDFMAPTRICFGGNNRSVAIRIPDAKPRRIEHRVSSPETDEYLAICAILIAIYDGLKHPCEIETYEKIHGNAFDDQYDLVDFPKDIEEAARKFRFFI